LEFQSVISEALNESNYAIVYSIDMSAAFDLLSRNVLLHELRSRGSLECLTFLISDLLDGRKMKTEVADGKLSKEYDLKVGYVQGLTLELCHFTIYCKGIPALIGADHYITNADESYVITIDEDLQCGINRMSNISRSHILALENLVMKVNAKKSEVVVFSKNPLNTLDVSIGDDIIKTSPFMKVLIVYFASKLRWEKHIRHAISKWNSKLAVLKKLRRNFNLEQFKSVSLTSNISHNCTIVPRSV